MERGGQTNVDTSAGGRTTESYRIEDITDRSDAEEHLFILEVRHTVQRQKDWGQEKRQRAIKKYKKDLHQAEEELQQLHFSKQSRGMEDTGKAEPSEDDDKVW